MKYLSVADILYIWASISGEEALAGIRSYDLLESAVSKPKASFGGQDIYEGPVVKAVVLCEAIIKNHPFVDGNKRTGVIAMLTFLEINGYDTSSIPDDLLYDIAMGFAEGSLKREEVAGLLEHFLSGADNLHTSSIQPVASTIT